VKAVHGVKQDEPRWRMCVRYVNDNFGMAVGRIFVERHFNERAKANVSIHRLSVAHSRGAVGRLPLCSYFCQKAAYFRVKGAVMFFLRYVSFQ